MIEIKEYEKLDWQDHITERPGTFKEINNNDGTVTHVPQEGEILQEGTPVSANNLNHMDEGIYNVNRHAKDNRDMINRLAIEVSILKGSAVNGITHNIFVVNFEKLDDVNLQKGYYDEVNRRVVV